ncbi:MAG: flavin reductase family protein [Balneolaceae bacterium]
METVEERSEALKQVMRQMPFPVTIVTAAREDSKRGITIGSFTSLSMDPPLVSFNVDKSSQMHDLLMESDYFNVHIPHEGQAGLCSRFAIPDQTGEEQFDQIPYTIDERGLPLLEDMVAVIRCKNYKQVEAGDHTLFMGEVSDISIQKEDTAILYLNGVYHHLRF